MPYMVKENLCCFSTGYSKVRTEHSASFCVLNIGLNPKGSVPEVGMHPQGFPLSTLPARLPWAQNPAATWDGRHFLPAGGLGSKLGEKGFILVLTYPREFWGSLNNQTWGDQGGGPSCDQGPHKVPMSAYSQCSPNSLSSAGLSCLRDILRIPQSLHMINMQWIKIRRQISAALGSSLGECWLTWGGRGRCCHLGVQ